MTKRFGGTVAAEGLSFQVPAEQVTSLIGPNGAGKTTVVSMIAGRRAPDEGEILLSGRRLPARAHRAAQLGVGRLFQDVRVFGSLTVLENVQVAVPQQAGERVAVALGKPRLIARQTADARQRALAELDFVGLADRADSRAGALSYGQQKLVAIARLLAGGARLLLLDEPASGVNPALIERLAKLVRDLVATGRTVLLVEHNMALVEQVSDQVVLLDRGRLQLAGPTAEVFASPTLREVYLPAGSKAL